MRSPRPSRNRSDLAGLRRPGAAAVFALAVALAVPAGASATATPLTTPISGFVGNNGTKTTGTFADVTAATDGHLWIAEPDPLVAYASSIGNIFSASADGTFMHAYATGAASGAGAPTITSGILPTHIAASSDGALWYSADGSSIGRMTTTGHWTLSTIPTTGPEAGGSIGELAADANGNVWYVDSSLGRIGEASSGGGLQSWIAGVTPGRITMGPDGNIWFTVPSTDQIGRMTPGGAVTIFALPVLPPGDTLTAIAAGGDGNVWVGSAETFFKVSVTGTVLATYTLPGYTANTQITDMAKGPDGNVWFTETSPNQIGRLFPDGTFTADSTKSFQNTVPIAITPGTDSNLYYVGTNDGGTSAAPNNVLGKITPTDVPHGAVTPVTDASESTATLSVVENPTTAATTVHFEWGVTTQYGNVTPDNTIAAGGVTPITAPLNGLSSGTVYHYRVVATSDNGSSFSSDNTFKTTGVAKGPIFNTKPTIPPTTSNGKTPNLAGATIAGALSPQTTVSKLASSGVTRLLVKCNATTACKATVVLTATVGKKKSVAIATKSATVKAGASAKLGLRLSKAGAKAVRKAGKKGLSVLVTVTVDGVKKRYRLTITK